MFTLILVAIAATLIAFLLSAADTALSRMSRHRADQLADEERRGSGSLLKVMADTAPYLSVATFVRVVAEATTAVAVTVAVDTVMDSHWQTALVAIAIMSVVSFVVVGVSPRTLGRQHGEKVALMAAPVVHALRLVLGPVAKLLVLFGNALTPGRGYAEGPFASESELRDLVDLAGESAVIEAEEREMIHSIFELGDTVARELMVPRPDMVTIQGERVLRQAMSLFLRSGFSRVPVIGEGSDDVLGLLYFKDVARQVNAHPDGVNTVPVTDVMRPVHRIPESKSVDGLLREMQEQRQHFAIVIDEYGGTAGLITIEDILEEIVGEITDEYDRSVDEVETLEDGTLRVPAGMSVDDLAELFDVEIENEDADTVGGLLSAIIGMVPLVGSSGQVAGLELTAERMAGRRRRVATVLVREVEEETAPEEGEAVPETDTPVSGDAGGKGDTTSPGETPEQGDTPERAEARS
ncbi:hemolysin family protein [Ornithinicoccus hortensis]|uniref:CBS domain containing-hemolysin-like protein n=1 Tax=Ornithinicoccus hortensis TaxID=82346 RepID=A0A542YS34_9MICO|nr:hemolysin family protein [Ornithinicoccus hortensis]TQL50877.1 CBS domain containing-hemolysin-like protein [Ornithinicoccus hortensis]